jgi:hypothetical protein
MDINAARRFNNRRLRKGTEEENFGLGPSISFGGDLSATLRGDAAQSDSCPIDELGNENCSKGANEMERDTTASFLTGLDSGGWDKTGEESTRPAGNNGSGDNTIDPGSDKHRNNGDESNNEASAKPNSARHAHEPTTYLKPPIKYPPRSTGQEGPLLYDYNLQDRQQIWLEKKERKVLLARQEQVEQERVQTNPRAFMGQVARAQESWTTAKREAEKNRNRSRAVESAPVVAAAVVADRDNMQALRKAQLQEKLELIRAVRHSMAGAAPSRFLSFLSYLSYLSVLSSLVALVSLGLFSSLPLPLTSDI